MDRLSTKGSIIDQLDLQNVPRSGFDRSFHNYLSCTLGKIVPTRVEEVLPGDRIKGSTHIVANFEPLAGPILGNMVLKQETFYVPQSVLWKSAHNFFTGKKGFNGNVPLITHKQICEYLSQTDTRTYASLLNLSALESAIYDAFGDYIQNVASSTSGADLFDSFGEWLKNDYDPDDAVMNTLWYEFVVAVQTWRTQTLSMVENFGDDNFVVDLLQPYVKRLNNLVVNVDSQSVPNTYLGSQDYTAYEQLEYFISQLTEIIGFFFGPSSHLDYMGVGLYDLKKLLTGYFYSLSTTTYELTAISDQFPDIPFGWLPFRAAYCIWYWNYRDQLLEQNALDAEEFMDNDTYTKNEVVLLCLSRQRCWFKDTFTTALTNTGNGNILIPSLAAAYSQAASALQVGLGSQNLSNTDDAAAAKMAGADVQTFIIGGISYSVPTNYLVRPVQGGSETNVSTDYYVSLDLIDRAKRLSSWVSKRLALGVEYDDVVYSSFMVKLSHVRMRTPELLDAGRSTVAINTVVNNTTIPNAQVAGDKTAVAWAENNTDGVNYFAEEHGYLLSFMTILPIQSYAGGINRMYLRQNRFDFAWPEFSQMGLDAVFNCELAVPYSQGQHNAALAVFGYQGRYYDYKSKLDEEHGRMRGDLNYMTFSRDFELTGNNAPKLNYVFVHCWPSLDMFVTDDPSVDVVRSVDIAHNYHWERVLPVPSEILR